jgi:hypothetical protein
MYLRHLKALNNTLDDYYSTCLFILLCISAICLLFSPDTERDLENLLARVANKSIPVNLE